MRATGRRQRRVDGEGLKDGELTEIALGTSAWHLRVPSFMQLPCSRRPLSPGPGRPAAARSRGCVDVREPERWKDIEILGLTFMAFADQGVGGLSSKNKRPTRRPAVSRPGLWSVRA